MNKNWTETIINVPGTLKTNETGEIVFTLNKHGKYSTTLKVSADTPWSRLERKNTWVVVDNLREQDVKDLNELMAAGEITSTTRLVITGHLVRTPGKPGMNDFFNLKTLGMRPEVKGENITVNLDEALTKDEWQVIRKEKFGVSTNKTEAPTAPVAPSVPF